MDIISRAEWGATYGDGVGTAPLPASELWLHHSVTVAPDVIPPFTDDDAAIRTIERIGAERFGDAYGFPYTFGVTPVGRIYEGHNLRKNGAHTKGRNYIARAIVLVGNYDVEPPTMAQQLAVAWLVRHGHANGWWTVTGLSGGHRDAPGASTACPGQFAEAVIPHINELALFGTQTQEDEDMFALVWNSERTAPPILVGGGAVYVVTDNASEREWTRVGAKRVVQTDRDYRALLATIS